jgi:Lar family restriction alleviation protein
MEKIELKPCPFCGESKDVVVQKILSRERWYVHCGNCKCRTFQYLDRREAIKTWNRRADNEN